MPRIIPYEIFLSIIEILAYEAEAALKEIAFSISYSDEAESHLAIELESSLHPLCKFGDQLKRYHLVHNILHIDSKTRTIVHAITKLRPFPMTLTLLHPREDFSFSRTGWVSLELDSFYLTREYHPSLKDALRNPTLAASDLIDCMRRVYIGHNEYLYDVRNVEAVASLPNLEEITFHIDHFSHELDHELEFLHHYRFKYEGKLKPIRASQFPDLAAWVNRFGSSAGFRPIWALLKAKGVTVLVKDNNGVDTIELFHTSKGFRMKLLKCRW